MEKNTNDNKFKEVWNNKRYRALIILTGYLTFFIVMGVLLDFNAASETFNERENSNTSSNMTSSTNKFSTLSNYDFYYHFTYLDEQGVPTQYVNVDGYRYEEKQVVMIRETEQTFYLENGEVYEVSDTLKLMIDSFFFNFDKISPSKISDYIKEGTLESKTEYSDGMVKKNYEIPIRKFSKIYQESEMESEENIFISVYEKDNIVSKVEMDLSHYNNMKLELNYKEINKVQDFLKTDLIAKD